MKPTFADLLTAARTGPDEHFYKVLKAYEAPERPHKALDPSTLRALIWLVILLLAPLVFVMTIVYLAL